MDISHHHIVHFKYIVALFVDYTSIKLKKKKECFELVKPLK